MNFGEAQKELAKLGKANGLKHYEPWLCGANSRVVSYSNHPIINSFIGWTSGEKETYIIRAEEIVPYLRAELSPTSKTHDVMVWSKEYGIQRGMLW